MFISHAWRYHDDYRRLIKLLDKAKRFEYANYSVPKDESFDNMSNPELYDQLRDQIRRVESVVILAGLYVSYSNWIKFEINYAQKLDKPLIGVQPWGNERTPQRVSQAANTVVGWNSKTIVRAIRDYS